MQKKQVLGAFIIVTMVFSVVGLTFVGDTTANRYNGYVFTQTTRGWQVELYGKQQEYLFFPQNLEQIPLPDLASTLGSKKAIVVTYNPDSDIAETFADYQYTYEQQINPAIYIIRATTNQTTLPLYTCANATDTMPVISFEEQENSSITQIGNCLVVAAFDAYGFAQEAERLLYAVNGVMQ